MTDVVNNTVTQTMHETVTATMTDVVNNVSAFVLHGAGLGIGVRCPCGACMESGHNVEDLPLHDAAPIGKFPVLF